MPGGRHGGDVRSVEFTSVFYMQVEILREGRDMVFCTSLYAQDLALCLLCGKISSNFVEWMNIVLIFFPSPFQKNLLGNFKWSILPSTLIL